MSKRSGNGGIGILGVLGIVFIVLKLVEVIDWPWWLVLLPFYGGFVLFIGIILIAMLGITIFNRKP